jgi:hypothetical protein
MLDGNIVYDEATAVGEIPTRVQRAVSAMRQSDDDEKAANVSAVMETMPDPTEQKKHQSKKKKHHKRGKKR